MDIRQAEKQGYKAFGSGVFMNPFDVEEDQDLYWAWEDGYDRAADQDDD